MANEKKRFTEQELNSDDYKKTVHGAKALKEFAAIGSIVGAAAVVIVKHGPKLIKNLAGLFI